MDGVKYAILKVYDIILNTDKPESQWHTSHSVYADAPIKINCKFRESPTAAKFEILQNEQSIPLDGRYAVTQTNNSMSILIPSVSHKEAAKYTCRAELDSNAVYEASLSINIMSSFSLPKEYTECQDPQFRNHYCLNGGRCFITGQGSEQLYNCLCPEGFSGALCRDRVSGVDIDFTRQWDDVERIQIITFCLIGSIFGLLMLLLFKDLILGCFNRKRNKHFHDAPSPITPNFAPIHTVRMSCSCNCNMAQSRCANQFLRDSQFKTGVKHRASEPGQMFSQNRGPGGDDCLRPPVDAQHTWSGSWPVNEGGRRAAFNAGGETLDRRRKAFNRSRKMAVSEADLVEEQKLPLVELDGHKLNGFVTMDRTKSTSADT